MTPTNVLSGITKATGIVILSLLVLGIGASAFSALQMPGMRR